MPQTATVTIDRDKPGAGVLTQGGLCLSDAAARVGARSSAASIA
jgi:hypothetical protein